MWVLQLPDYRPALYSTNVDVGGGCVLEVKGEASLIHAAVSHRLLPLAPLPPAL